jgi:hypothetical protein
VSHAEPVDIQVFDQQGRGREFEVVVGLAFLEWLNGRPNNRVDGVNISLSIPCAIDNFACGGTPVCLACERLVADGMVVVVSAGNSGFGDTRGTTTLGPGFQLISISDPGNAEDVITVGATHRTDPHKYGPISRSARGLTADGRNKPDLLAPDDRVWGPVPNGGWGQKSGTSQAAPWLQPSPAATEVPLGSPCVALWGDRVGRAFDSLPRTCPLT